MYEDEIQKTPRYHNHSNSSLFPPIHIIVATNMGGYPNIHMDSR